jgi:transcriptional regulator with XRE-family HTH domain
MNIADRIQSLRKSKGISQEELADAIGVSRQAVSKWESEQSIPEIDKVIIMSDFFEVTTDYILKGIETGRQANTKALNANIFVSTATFLNFVGLIVAGAIWYEKQVAMAVVGGLILMAAGCMQYGIGVSFSTLNKEKAKRTFWTINIWLLVFIPMSFMYNILFTGTNAPYPVSGVGYSIAFPVFWLVYIAVCLVVVFTQVKARRKK